MTMATPAGTALAAAIAAALAEQQRFESRRATRLGRGFEHLTTPIAGPLARLVPPALLRQVLESADGLARHRLPYEASDHDRDDLDACETTARRVQAWASGANALSGGIGGFFGAAGLAADVPATLLLAAHTVRATACAYGITGDDPAERAYRLAVLDLATALADRRRAQAIAAIRQLATRIDTLAGPPATDPAAEWLLDKVVERIARQLGLSLGGRKLGQVVPVVGGLVAAGVNAGFQTDIARSARYAYRQRWLMGRRLLPATIDTARPEPQPQRNRQ